MYSDPAWNLLQKEVQHDYICLKSDFIIFLPVENDAIIDLVNFLETLNIWWLASIRFGFSTKFWFKIAHKICCTKNCKVIWKVHWTICCVCFSKIVLDLQWFEIAISTWYSIFRCYGMAKMKPLFRRHYRGHIKVLDRGSSLLSRASNFSIFNISCMK